MRNRVYKDIDLSLKTDFRSDVRKKTNVDAINQHLKLLVLTEQDEVPFLNNVSADVRNLLFQPYTPHVKNTLNEVIRNIVKQYEKRIEVTDVSNFLEDHNLAVSISYVVKQDNVVGQFKTILKKTR